jgi:hypothetical protein
MEECMKKKAEETKDEMLAKTADELTEGLKKRWANYDKWANFQWGWWKPEDKVHWPRFDGQGEAKGPYITYSGRHSVDPPKIEKQVRMVNNTWMNSYYMWWKILHDELGREKTNELVGYLWLAQAAQIVKLVDGMDEKDRNCLAVSKMLQMECYIECVDIDVVEESPERFQVRYLCNWWRHIVERWKAQGIGYDDMGLCEPCVACCEYYGRAIHPKISCTVTAHPMDSGSYCEMVYEMND